MIEYKIKNLPLYEPGIVFNIKYIAYLTQSCSDIDKMIIIVIIMNKLDK